MDSKQGKEVGLNVDGLRADLQILYYLILVKTNLIFPSSTSHQRLSSSQKQKGVATGITLCHR